MIRRPLWRHRPAPWGVLAALVIIATGEHQAVAQMVGAPAPLNTNAATDAGSDDLPQIASDGVGTWVAVWESTETLAGTLGSDRDVLVSRSTDDGATWTAPAALNSNAATDGAFDGRPLVKSDGSGTWIAVWDSQDSLGGMIGGELDILVSHSTDDGATWTASAALNTNAATDSGYDRRPRMATDAAGTWIVVWESNESLGGTIGTDYDILFSRSTDGGATWTAPTALNTNASTDSGSDSAPEICTDGAGNWISIWYSGESFGGTLGTDSDMLVARSSDSGATWTAPAALNSNAATDSGADSFSDIATDGTTWVAVWGSRDSLGGTIGTDWDVLVSRSLDAGASWSTPAVLNANATTDGGTTADSWPQVVSDGAGTWLAVWHSQDSLGGAIGQDWDVLLSLSTDAGSSWSEPTPLNTNAATDAGLDHYPRVGTDGAGTWLAVWRSEDALGGSIGTDMDILFTAVSPSVPASIPALTHLGVALTALLLAGVSRVLRRDGRWRPACSKRTMSERREENL